MENNTNPLVSLCLFCYNQEKYIKQAVESALAQTYNPLEIIISDDCSSDSTFEIVKEIVNNYRGAHKIVLNRNDKNLGICGHVSKILYDLAQGDYVSIVAGDDFSSPDHIEVAVKFAKKYPDINKFNFSAKIIDENGKITDTFKADFECRHSTIEDFILFRTTFGFAPGMLLKRDFIFSFNPLSSSCPVEDMAIGFRCYMMGGFMKVNKPLIYYRRHSSNLSSPDSLRKMSNAALISQHLTDLVHAYEKKMISDKMYEILLERIYLELRGRNVLSSEHVSKVKYIYFRIIRRLFILKMKFLLKSKHNLIYGS